MYAHNGNSLKSEQKDYEGAEHKYKLAIKADPNL